MVGSASADSGDQLTLGLKGAGSILLLVFLGLFFLDFILSVLSANAGLLGVFSPVSEVEVPTVKSAVSKIASPCVMFLITWIGLKLKYRGASFRELLESFGMTPVSSPTLLLCAFFSGVAYHSILTYVLVPLFPPRESLLSRSLSAIFALPTEFAILAVVGGVLLAPIAEEYLFRGVIYKGLEQRWNKSTSMIVVSVIFILVHPSIIFSGYWLTYIFLFAFPFVLVIAREVMRSLYGSILLHSGYNLSEYVMYISSNSG